MIRILIIIKYKHKMNATNLSSVKDLISVIYNPNE